MIKNTLGGKIVLNTIYLSVSEIIVRIFSFFSIAYLARVLKTDGFGQLEFSNAFIYYFSLFGLLGLNTFGNREVAKSKEKSAIYLGNIITIQMLSAMVSMILLFIFLYFSSKEIVVKQLLLIQSISILGTILNIEWIFMGLKKMQHVAISRIVNQAIYFILIILIIKNYSQILYIPIISLIASFISITYLWIIISRNEKIIFRPSFNLKIWKIFFIQSIPMMLSYLLTRAYYNIDLVFLSFFKSNEIVGLYGSAYKVVNLFVSFRLMIAGVLFPFFSQLYVESIDKLKKLLTIVQKLAISFILPVTIGGLIISKEIITIVFGVDFLEATSVFRILILIIAFDFFNISFPILLNAANLQHRYLWIISFISIGTIIFYLLLIPKYSMYGTAIVSVIGSVVTFILFYREAQKVVSMNIFIYFIKPIICSVVMLIFLLLFPQLPLLIKVIFAGLIYYISLLLFKYFSKEELSSIKTIFTIFNK